MVKSVRLRQRFLMSLLLIAGGVVLGLILFVPAMYLVGIILAGVVFVLGHIISVPYWIVRSIEWVIVKSLSLIRLAFLRLRSYRGTNLFL